MTNTKTTADAMAVTMARLLTDSRNVFHGLASPLPAVAIALARREHNHSLLYLNIAGGVNIQPDHLESSTCSPAYLNRSESFFSLIDIFDFSARGQLDTAFLGGVQIDRFGRINNSVIGSFDTPKVKLPGGAGSAAIVPTAARTIVWRTRHDRRSFVDRCDFITACGNVREVVTPLGMLRIEDGELRLAGWFSHSNPKEIRENTGFSLIDTADCAELPPPTVRETALLQELDPEGVRFSEFR